MVVVKAPGDDVDLRCGGAAMVVAGEVDERLPIDASFSEGVLMGKRYSSDEVGIELLCTKPGKGSLSIGDEPLGVKDAKPLPSSD
jgi:hypothetical protein